MANTYEGISLSAARRMAAKDPEKRRARKGYQAKPAKPPVSASRLIEQLIKESTK